jgi:hypothetical protein
MASSWRRLPFFAQSATSPAPEALAQATAACSLSDGGVAVASQGTCHLLRADLSARASFAAHASGVTHLVQPSSSPLLVSVGLEPEGGVDRACVRVWREEDGEVQCARTLQVFGASGAGGGASEAAASSEPAITCVAVAADVSQIALGLHDGSVLLLRTTDVARERFLRFKALSSVAARGAAVSNVHFCYSQPDAPRTPTELWVCTADALVCVAGAGLRSEACTSLAEGGGALPRTSPRTRSNPRQQRRDPVAHSLGPATSGRRDAVARGSHPRPAACGPELALRSRPRVVRLHERL